MIQINSIKVVTEFVDSETGEVFTDERILGEETKKAKKSTSSSRSKKPKDNDPIPKITLLEGKWQMNAAAIELTQFEPEMKLDIQFEKKGRQITPVLLQDDKNGNRLTKTYTVSCRGTRHDNLAKYGDIFELEPREDGTFKLKGNIELPEDDIIDIPEEISSEDELDNSVDLDDIDFNF